MSLAPKWEHLGMIFVLFLQLLHLFSIFNCVFLLTILNVCLMLQVFCATHAARFSNWGSQVKKYKIPLITAGMAMLFTFPSTFIFFEYCQSFLIVVVWNSLASKSEDPHLPSNTGSDTTPRQRRITMDEGERILELMEQGYFLYRQTRIAPFNTINSVYVNRKGREMLCEVESDVDDLLDYLGKADSSKKSLREFLKDSLAENVQSGNVEKATLTLIRHKESAEIKESAVLQIIPFKNYKAEIWKLSKTDVLIVLSERSGKQSLSLLDGLRQALVCTLCHDLKTLANGVMGNIELIDEQNLNKEQRVHHNIALSSSYILSSRLKDLFDYIQLQNGGFRLHYAEVDLGEVLRTARHVGGGYAGQKQLSFTFRKKGRLPRAIVGDKERIEQVLMNVVCKAIEFTDYGKIELMVSKKRERQIVFKVTSYGQSMQTKMEQQMRGLPRLVKQEAQESLNENMTTPVRRRISGTSGTVKNFEALSLEICQVICREMGTQIVVKNVRKQYSQLKFILNDGFHSTKQSCARLADIVRTFEKSTVNLFGDFKEEIKCNSGDLSKSSDVLTELRDHDKPCRFSQFADPSLRKPAAKHSSDLILTLDEIPNEIGSTTPINLPKFRSTSLISDLSRPRILKFPSNFSSAFHEELKEEIKEITPIRPFNESPPMTLSAAQTPPAPLPILRSKGRRITTMDPPARRTYGTMGNLDDVARYSILIVDDDAINRQVLKGLLRKFGHNSIEARDGKEAVSLIEGYIKTEKLYELTMVFMDLQMPVLNGAVATQQILELCRQSLLEAPPIVGLTADPIETDRTEFLRAGIRELLHKPVNSRKIEYIIRKYIRRDV